MRGECRSVLSGDAVGDFLEDMAGLGVDGFSFISEYYRFFVPDFLARAQAAGFLAYAWDFNLQNAETMTAVMDLGLDGYIVNDVASFAALIPEPASGLLLAAGLISLAACRSRA